LRVADADRHTVSDVGARSLSSGALELWIKHLKPVWKGELARMKEAIADWRKDMIESGLGDDDLPDLEKFL
jgi:hypothetical protein